MDELSIFLFTYEKYLNDLVRFHQDKTKYNYICVHTRCTSTERDEVLAVRRIDWENLNREVEKVHSLLGIGAEEHLVGGSQVRNNF